MSGLEETKVSQRGETGRKTYYKQANVKPYSCHNILSVQHSHAGFLEPVDSKYWVLPSFLGPFGLASRWKSVQARWLGGPSNPFTEIMHSLASSRRLSQLCSKLVKISNLRMLYIRVYDCGSCWESVMVWFLKWKQAIEGNQGHQRTKNQLFGDKWQNQTRTVVGGNETSDVMESDGIT